jgi:hypothetical protein
LAPEVRRPFPECWRNPSGEGRARESASVEGLGGSAAFHLADASKDRTHLAPSMHEGRLEAHLGFSTHDPTECVLRLLPLDNETTPRPHQLAI